MRTPKNTVNARANNSSPLAKTNEIYSIRLPRPSEMTPEERMRELASILAMGFIRLKSGIRFSSESGTQGRGT